MGLNFGELHLERDAHAVTEVSIDGFFFRVAFKRRPDGTISDPIISGVGRPSDTLLERAKQEAKAFRERNSSEIDAMLPRL